MHEVLRLRGRRGRGRGFWNDNAGRTWPPDGGWRAGRVFRNCSTASRPALGARRGWRGAARAPRIDYTPLRTALPAGLRKFVRRLADEWYPPPLERARGCESSSGGSWTNFSVLLRGRKVRLTPPTEVPACCTPNDLFGPAVRSSTCNNTVAVHDRSKPRRSRQ